MNLRRPPGQDCGKWYAHAGGALSTALTGRSGGRRLLLACALWIGCAPTLADLRDHASDVRPEDVLRLASEAFDTWHAAALRSAETAEAIAELDAVDATWGRLWGDSVRTLRLYRADPATQAEAWRRARDALVTFLRALGSIP